METFREQIHKGTRKERKSTIGAFKHFMTDIYRERFLSPHEEMLECVNAYNFNSIIHSSVNTMSKFIIGNDIKIVSDDDATREFLQQMVDRTGLKQCMREVVENTIKTGNGFLEMDWEHGVPVRFYPICDSSRMYLNYDKFGNAPLDPETGDDLEEEYYLQRVDEIYPDPDAKFYNLGYHVSVRYYTLRIKAIAINKQKMIHFKMNSGDDGIYGRSILASCLNDWLMLREMERSIAIIAKFKSVPRKIFALGDRDMPATDEETINFAHYMENLSREQNPITNKPVKVFDLNYSGKNIDLSSSIEHVRKKLTTGLAPEFVLGFSKDTNRATAREELTAYILSIMTDREIFLEQINERILKPYIEKFNLEDANAEFGELDFEDSSAKTGRIVQQYQSDLITRNEAREMLGMDLLEDEEDNGDKFNSEVQAAAMGGGGMPDLMGGLGGLGGEPSAQALDNESQDVETPTLKNIPLVKPEEPTAQPFPHLRPKVMSDVEQEVESILTKKTKPIPKLREGLVRNSNFLRESNSTPKLKLLSPPLSKGCNHSECVRLKEGMHCFSLDEGMAGLKKNVLPSGKHPQRKLIAEYATNVVRTFREARNQIMSRLHADRRYTEDMNYKFTEEAKQGIGFTVELVEDKLNPLIADFIKKAYEQGDAIGADDIKKKGIKVKDTKKHEEFMKKRNEFLKKTIEANKKSMKDYSVKDLDTKLNDLIQKAEDGKMSVTEVGKEISKTFNKSAWKGLQVAQTEINRVHNEAVANKIGESGNRYFWWNTNPAASKEGVCKLCQSMANKCKTMDGFSVANKAHPRPVESTHPHCYCYITPHKK